MAVIVGGSGTSQLVSSTSKLTVPLPGTALNQPTLAAFSSVASHLYIVPTVVLNNYSLFTSSTLFSVTAEPLTLAFGHTLALTSQSYNAVPEVLVLAFSHKLSTTQQNFSVSSIQVTLGGTEQPSFASVAVSAQPAQLIVAHRLTTSVTTFQETTVSTTLVSKRLASTVTQTYNLNQSATLLPIGRSLHPLSAQFQETTVTTSVTVSRKTNVVVQSYGLTPLTTTLARNKLLLTSAANIATSSQFVLLTSAKKLTPSAVSVAISSASQNLLSQKIIAVLPASITVSLFPAVIQRSAFLTTQTQIYSVSGTEVFRYGTNLNVIQRSYVFNSQQATLLKKYVFTSSVTTTETTELPANLSKRVKYLRRRHISIM